MCRPRLRSARWPRTDGIYLDCRTSASTTGEIHKNTSAGKRPLLVAGERFQRGIGMVAPQQAVYDLKGRFQRFRSLVGVDAVDMYSRSDLAFEVWADGRNLWESSVLRHSDRSRLVDVDIAGAQTLTLTVCNVAPRPTTAAVAAQGAPDRACPGGALIGRLPPQNHVQIVFAKGPCEIPELVDRLHSRRERQVVHVAQDHFRRGLFRMRTEGQVDMVRQNSAAGQKMIVLGAIGHTGIED